MAKQAGGRGKGRPKGSGHFPTSINLRLTQDMRDKVERYAKRAGHPNNADAMRDILGQFFGEDRAAQVTDTPETYRGARKGGTHAGA